jgi:PadR family transcriptional regulator, regulatory protein PadR
MCNQCSHPSKDCRCRSRRSHGFIPPRLLLYLAAKPAHGYELIEALGQEDSVGLDAGNLYRALRNLEEEGLVKSSWDTANSGPARRIYELTGSGFEILHRWAIDLEKTRRRLDNFLIEYKKLITSEELIPGLSEKAGSNIARDNN